MFMNIGMKIQTLRKQKGLSQEQLAESLGVSRQAVSKWEADQSIPDLDKVVAICDYFDVSSDYILRDAELPSASAPTPEVCAPVQEENTYYNYNEPQKTYYDELEKDEVEKKRRLSAFLLAVSVMLYIMCVIPPIAIRDDVIGPVLMFVMIAAATGMIIYRAVALSKLPKVQNTAVHEKVNDPVWKAVISCVWAADIAAYFIVSFATGAWYITWLIFPIGSAVAAIASAVYDLKRSGEE